MSTVDKSIIAKISKNGKNFEILIDPDDHSLVIDEVFLDSKKGLRAGSGELESAFNTTDVQEIAKNILAHGKVHTTSEQRDKERNEKLNRIVALIALSAVDPRTHAPIPADTISKGLDEAVFRLDSRPIEDQLPDAIKKLRPIIAFTFEEKRIQVSDLPPTIAGQCMRICKNLGTTESEKWNGDGSLTIVIRIPAGLQEEFMDKINSLTHGKTQMEFLK